MQRSMSALQLQQNQQQQLLLQLAGMNPQALAQVYSSASHNAWTMQGGNSGRFLKTLRIMTICFRLTWERSCRDEGLWQFEAAGQIRS